MSAPEADNDLQRLSHLPLDLWVSAGGGVLTLGRLRALAPGEVLPLGRRADGTLVLTCGGVLLGEVEVEDEEGSLTATVTALETLP